MEYKKDSGTLEFHALGEHPRLGNKIHLDKYENVARDGSENKEACMNCNNFETFLCPLTDTRLHQIEMDDHCCEQFEWWTGEFNIIALDFIW